MKKSMLLAIYITISVLCGLGCVVLGTAETYNEKMTKPEVKEILGFFALGLIWPLYYR